MSYGFMVWAVDTNKLKQAAGSKDEKLRRMIGGRFKRDLARLDELFEGSGGPNTYEALRQIIDGTVPPDARGAIYSYAFKLLVEHFGRFLDNAAVYPWSSPDFAPVNAALKQMEVPFELDDLHGSRLPIQLPSPDDFPLTGWVGEAEVKKISAAFERAKSPQGETGAIIDCVRGWFRDAAAQDRGLVSYYH
ncbi:hypothetical protein JY651_41235 [Pyxidicoccus parkwayensis]|uniref:DUF7691 domain-containing protein n=1 Tax=Pyxidicoccus parkwayensis TaxID=2813578 RepID=A0ABX7NRN2_9BACT|nr:hypothetical protein [Pyxidicoccus parkwaysis]QSQ21542.1 hypothetical protein JY651_41235 [Pyxidicoccus parkwaysis]